MKTQEKIEAIREFLSSPDNKLIWSKGENLQAGTFFNIEISGQKKQIDFSICTEVTNIEEAVSILKEVTINKDTFAIKTELDKHLSGGEINPDDGFYIIVKGNKDDRKTNI